MNNLKDLEIYYSKLYEQAEGKISDRFYNEDRAHNAIVMAVMFAFAKNVKMYCGELSIFREGFKSKVESDINQNSKTESQFDPMGKLYENLNTFLQEGNNLEIIIEKPCDDIKNEKIYKEILAPYIAMDQVKIYKFKEDFRNYEDAFHFSVGDDCMYRRESDKERHDAIGCWNNPEGAQVHLTRFEQLKSFSIPF